MKAEVLSVGWELLRGEIIDTNAPYLATQLLCLGVAVEGISAVGDDLDKLVETISRALSESDIVIITGGLGPTEDDLTREAIARVLGEELYVDRELERWLREFFASRGLSMPERNIKQAMLIPSARPLPNPRGTAPGWWVERGEKLILALPGPPAEMERMWEKEVLPRLYPRLGAAVILTRTLKTFGLSEAAVDEALTPVLKSPNPTIGIYAKPDGIHVCLTARASDEETARRLISDMESRVRELVGVERVWGVDAQTLEGVVGELLMARGLSLATMESCTGGLLANVITDVPGSSRYFRGGFVAYTNEMKMALGVPEELIREFGAVSPQVAEAMASAARRRLEADVGVGITGVAGPDPLEDKPPGTVHISIDARGNRFTSSFTYRFDRLRFKRVTTTAALFQLQKVLNIYI